MEEICTVCMISYNHAPYIERAIKSVLEQKTDYNYKIHIFDDCSTDGTQEIIKRYEKKFPEQIKIFFAEKNQGAQKNFWSALQTVDTKYFILLECDDYWCDNKKLELQIAALEKNPQCSFCGHDTQLITLDESCREYAEGANTCTEPLLKTKSIFSLKDFYPIDSGGYIPYVSARLIRSKCIDLSKIKHKESILFDFCQFYYLLLQGDYYYIDRPMSVYQRTGNGVCSSKDHLIFLNVFVQNAIDFNEETNNYIADKIFRECRLQISFRIELDKRVLKFCAPTPILKESNSTPDNHLLMRQNKLNPDEFYFLCNGGIGHTMLVCGLKEALEKKYQSKIILLVTETHEFLMWMYGERNYYVIDFSDVDIEALSNQCPNPEKGKIFVAHPFAHQEQTNFYLPMLGLYSSINFLDWFKDFLRLPRHELCNMPRADYEKAKAYLPKNILDQIPLEQIILFFPESYTLAGIATKIWEIKASELKEEGFTIISCVQNPLNTIPGTIYWKMSLAESIALAMHCHSVYAARNGVCDVLCFLGNKLHVYYSSHSGYFQYSLKEMFCATQCYEEIILKPLVYSKQTVPATTVMPSRAKLFGVLPVPEFAYQFYLKHKHVLQFFKRFVKWQY